MSDEAESTTTPAAREQLLMQELAAAPVVEVLGVVKASGVGGCKSRGDSLWTLLLTFEVWRIAGSVLDHRRLTIRRHVTEEELTRFRESIRSYDVLKIRARVVVDSPFGSPQGWLESLVGIDTSDAELNEQAELLQQPVTFDDPLFGTFTLDRSVNSFSAETTWLDVPVKLHLDAADDDDVQAALQTARVLWSNQAGWHRRISDFAVQKLLKLKNDVWLEEGERDVTAKEFIALMVLQTIEVVPDGSFEFWHDDGDLFWGHSILVRGTLANGPTEADLSG